MSQDFLSEQNLRYLIYGPPRYIYYAGILFLIVLQVFFRDPISQSSSQNSSTLAQSFGNSQHQFSHYNIKSTTSGNDIVITLGGDLRFSTRYQENSSANINNALSSFNSIFSASDISYITLDGPITQYGIKRTCTEYEANSRRCCLSKCFWKNPIELAPGLKNMNINVLGIENDHSLDYGFQGVEDTITLSQKSGLIPSGFNQKPIINIKGCNVAIFTYNWAYYDESFFLKTKNQMLNDLQVSEANVKIVVMHGGNQNKKEPSDLQVQFAQAAIDNGAKLIVGTHSKLPMTQLTYKDVPILYGLGSIMSADVSGKPYNPFNLVQVTVSQCKNLNLQLIKGMKNIDKGNVTIKDESDQDN